ncbi:MAG TPA: hypothetical protein VEH27_19375 [Methylomirabilota bacterium]|nr:hypothetical protein [Methylomirabilota bacterium]
MSTDPKLRHKHVEQQRADGAASSQSETVSFQHAEEAIRFDAEQVEPPASIAERLNESIAKEQEQQGGGSWWKRLFGQ